MKGYMKGQENNLLGMGVSFVAGLLFIGIILAVGAIANTGMATGLDANTSHGVALTGAPYVLGNGTSSLMNLAGQMPTIGTIAGVGLIILVLFVAVGAYIFGRK